MDSPYETTVFIFGDAEMDTNEWVARCSARLHAQWPRLHREQRDEVAKDLWNDQRWQQSEPEVTLQNCPRQMAKQEEVSRDNGEDPKDDSPTSARLGLVVPDDAAKALQELERSLRALK